MQLNPRVSLLFIDFEQPRRLRVLGSAGVPELPALSVRADVHRHGDK